MTKKTILCIDDKIEELDRAKVAVESCGYEFLSVLVPIDLHKARPLFRPIADTIARADGLVTDVFYNPFPYELSWANYDGNNQPPAGLIVALHAIGLGVPTVLCSRMDSSGDNSTFHHGQMFCWIWDFYFSHKGDLEDSPDVGLVDNKNWEAAVDKLKYLMR